MVKVWKQKQHVLIVSTFHVKVRNLKATVGVRLYDVNIIFVILQLNHKYCIYYVHIQCCFNYTIYNFPLACCGI